MMTPLFDGLIAFRTSIRPLMGIPALKGLTCTIMTLGSVGGNNNSEITSGSYYLDELESFRTLAP